MTEEHARDEMTAGRRTEARTTIDELYSVQLSIRGVPALYQFRIWNLSNRGLCIVMQHTCAILGRISAGDVMPMTYYPPRAADAARNLVTRISHITPQEEGRFRGYCLVGLEILDAVQP
jgi:hypothetical protein